MGIRLLGPTQVDGDANLHPRDRMVLGALAVKRDGVITAEQLADAVWGDNPPSTWPKQLQIDVGRLRKALGPGAIETVPGGYRLAVRGDDLDADQFERLAERGRFLVAGGEADRAVSCLAGALGLWRGSPFTDIESWEPARSETARLEELRRTIAEDLLEARLAAGEHRQVAVDAERFVAEEPLREQRWAILARAQYACARQADALRSLQRARSTLLDQLGINPGSDLVALEQAILAQDPSLTPSRGHIEVRAACPYKGLAAYDDIDTDDFYGREVDVSACLERLRSASMLVVAGPSGCGKSSLVRAGLVPALRRAGRAAVVFVPGVDPDGALTDAIMAANKTAVLVIDQFEELFAAGPPAEIVQEFCERIVAYTSSQGQVVIAVRADHLGRMAVHAGLSRLVEQGLYLVGPLEGDALRRAIEQPAASAGLRVEAGLVDLLLRDTDGEPGALPLLSHALAETWYRREGNALTVDGYASTGGVRAAVARSADELYESLPVDQRDVLRSVVLRLVVPSLDGEPVRCRLAIRSLFGDPVRERIIGSLVRARLVTTEEDTVQLAHEALARAWPRLQSWLDDDVAGQRTLRHLAAAATGWDSLGRPVTELYRGIRLDTARQWRDASRPVLTDAETAFLNASVAADSSERDSLIARARRDARNNRRLRLAFASVAVLAAVALVAGSLAFVQRKRAERGQRAAGLRTLVVNAGALQDSRRELAALLAVEAHRLAPGAASDSALLKTFTAAPGVGQTIELAGGELGNGSLIMLPDGKTAVSGDTTGTLRLIDLTTGADRARFDRDVGPVDRTDLSVSPDGRWLASTITSPAGEPDGSILTVWDLQRGARRFADAVLPFRAGAVAISPDGRRVAVGGGIDGTIQIRDGETGGLLRDLEPTPRPEDAEFQTNTVAVAFTPDGQLIVGSQAGPIRFIDPTSGTEQARLEGAAQTSEVTLVLGADGHSLLTGGFHGLMLYALPSREPLWGSPAGVQCTGVAVAASLGQILCGVEGGGTVALDLATGAEVGPRFQSQHGNSGLLVTPGGTTLFEFSRGTSFRQWRLDGGGLTSSILPTATETRLLGYSADGRSLIVATDDGTINGKPSPVVELIDPRDGGVRDRLAGAVGAWPDVQPQRLVVQWQDGTVGRYDIATRARLGSAVDPGFDPDDLIVLPGGQVLAWSYDGAIQVVDLDTGQSAPPPFTPDPYLWLAAAPPTGRLYTEGFDILLRRRDPRSGAVVATSDIPVVSRFVAGAQLVVANTPDGELIALDPDTLQTSGEGFAAVRGHLDTMALSTADTRLLVLGVDRSLRLFDVDSRVQLGDEITVGRLGGAALRPDGLEAAVATDGGIVVWDLDPAHWAAAACKVGGRNLTKKEWETYIGDLAPYHTTCPEYRTVASR